MKNKKNVFLKIICIFIIIIFAIYLYGRYLNTKGFITNEIAITHTSLPKAYNGLKIVHFSDLHYGRTIEKNDLKAIVNEINLLNPDIVIFTGDLSDKTKISTKEEDILIEYLSKIEAKLFKFAVIGDYDEKCIDTYKMIMKESDFYLLNNTNKLIYNNSSIPINIIGLTNSNNYDELYNSDYYTITIFHQPDLIKDINNSNLILAGHSLGGQIKLPFFDGIIKIKGAETYINNYYQVNNQDLYISNGLGTQKYSFRLFNKPSINLYRLYTN